jgi:uncharacterized protein
MPKSRNDRQIDYIEFIVHDIAKTKAFYGGVFGWTFQDYGTPRPGGPLVILYGDDLPSLSEEIRKSGGRISKPIFAFPGGQRFHFLDPNGYELAVWTKAA